jgi:hypothetical protein
MTISGLSFAQLESRLREVPDGPSAILNTPKPYLVLNIIGWAGAGITLLPYALFRIMTPAMWMVTMAQIGFAVLAVAWLPLLVRSYGVLGWTLWRWRSDQVEQLGHDHPHLQGIHVWLGGFPVDILTEHVRTIRLAQRQLSSKLGLLAGGIDRLGILPVLVSLYLFLRNWKDLLNAPLWQIGLGVLLILLYLVTTAGSLMRIRMQLYESLLSDALERKQE